MFHLNLNEPKSVYFIGIGGISMSGLAMILNKEGFFVYGSDRDHSESTEALEKAGIRVLYGQKQGNVPKDCDFVVYTAAIKKDNPEYMDAEEMGLPLINRADLLGAIMENYKNSVTVSGTHGKTTTTSMITLILKEYTDPTASIGGILPAIGSNVCLGSSDFFVAEACEYTNSFYSFYPKYSVILNIEEDHPDFFKDLDDIRHSFAHFANNTKKGGCILINKEIPDYEAIASVPGVNIETFGFSSDCDLYPKDIAVLGGSSTFVPVYKGRALHPVTLRLPGRYNILNALGAISVCLKLGVPEELIAKGLFAFTGAHRRFEFKGEYNGATIIDDYAHHPTECLSCIGAARELKPDKLIVAFQPHTYTRTEALFDEFVEALSHADEVLLSEIYAAREDNPHGVSSRQIAEALMERGVSALFFETNKELSEYVEKKLMHGDMLITMGAGDIYSVGDFILRK